MQNSLVDSSKTVEGARSLSAFGRAKATLLSQYPFLLRALGLGIPLILLCAPTIGDLVNLWWTRYGFSYGFLVPLVSLSLAWIRVPALQRTPVAPALVGGSVWLIAATLLLLVSQIGGVITTAGVALILVLSGLVLLLCGYAYLTALAFPLAYLIFITPVLDLLIEPLEWPFQLLTATMSVFMLQKLGIPVLLEQNIFMILPTVTIKVARECSGAGLLLAVLAVGLPLAYLTLRAWWSRVTFVLCGVLIAIVANWVRLTVMGIYSQSGGKDLHGPYHILQGLFVDWVAFAFLFAAAWLLAKLDRSGPTPVLPREPRSPSRFIVGAPDWNGAWWLACVTLTAATLLPYWLERGAAERTIDLDAFPAVVGDWVIEPQPSDESIFGLQDPHQSLARTYRAPDDRRVQLYVAYLRTQRQGKELVGMGTAPLHERAIATDLRIGAVSLPANRTFIDKSHQYVPAVFWYHINGMSYADRSQAKLATIKQAFLRGRTDGALVLVSAERRTGQTEEQWKAHEEFAGVLFPRIQEYLP